MKKIVFTVLLASLTFLSGCATIPPPTETRIECNTAGECKVIVIYRKSAGNYADLGLLINEDIALDFTNSQRTLLSSALNNASITLKSNNLAIATKTATYQKSGQEVIALNKANVVNWLSSHNGSVDEIVLTVDNLKFDTATGTNSVTTEVTHNNNVLSGAAASWYQAPNSGGGNFQIQ